MTPPADGPVVVAVHGNGGGGFRFALVSPLLGAPDRFRPVTLPGFSSEPRDERLRTVADYADRLGDLVGGSGPAPVILGHGIGGSFALDLASRRPELFGGLILHAPVGAHLDTRLFPRLMGTATARAVVQRLISSKILRPVLRRRFFPNGAPASVLDQFFEEYRSCTVFGQMFEIITPEWFESVPPIEGVPTVLLWGEDDRVLASGQIEALRTKVPRAEVVVQPGWDHFPMIEQPESYAREILAIARRLASDPL